MKRYIILTLIFIPFSLTAQNYWLRSYSGAAITTFQGNTVNQPSYPPSITYNFPPNDSLLMSFDSFVYNTDSLDIGTDIYSTFATRLSGTYKVDADSGVYGDGLTRYGVIDTKEHSAAQLGLEKNMEYRLEVDLFRSLIDANNFFWTQYALGYWNVLSTGQVEIRLQTETGILTRFTSAIYPSADVWYNNTYFTRDNASGQIDANGTISSNTAGGQWPDVGQGYLMLDRISGGRGYNGWLRNLKMYNLGEVSTLAFNVNSDSSTVYENPNPYLDDFTITKPFPNVLEFTGGGTHGDYNISYIDIDFKLPSDYRSISNSSLFCDNKVEGDGYLRYAIYVNKAMFAQSDTVRGQATWDYHTTNRDNITISSRDKRKTDDLIYPTPEPLAEAKLRIWVFAKSGAKVSLRNIGMRYKSSTTATNTLHDNGTPTTVNLGAPLATISIAGDFQPETNGDFQNYVKPLLDTMVAYSDYLVTVGDVIEYDTAFFDSIANYVNNIAPNLFTTSNGNHDNYQNADLLNTTKSAFKRFINNLGVYSEIETYNGYDMVHTMTKVPNTDVYVIGYDNVDPTKLSTDIVWFYEPDTTWILKKIRDTLAVNADARFLISTHLPKASHDVASIGYGETVGPVQVFRAGLAEYPSVIGIVTGHRHLYGQSTEENELPCFVLSSMAKEAGHPINPLFADIYSDRVRFYFHNFAGTPLSANQKDGASSIFNQGTYFNQFSIYDDWWVITK